MTNLPEEVRGVRRRRAAAWLAVDVLAAVVLAIALLNSFPAWPAAPVGVGAALAVTMCLGVAVRRLVPVPALIVTVVASGAAAYFGFAKDPMLALGLVLYTVATRAPTLLAAAGLLLAESAVFTARYSHADSRMPSLGLISTAVVLAAAWAIGFAVRTQRAYAAGLRQQAEQQIQAEADRSQRALAEERLRIARELHDVIAHTMSVIAVQASVGAHVIDVHPAEGRATLRTIEEASRGALRELRSVLGVLRDRGTQSGDASALAPAPGLADLPALIERTLPAALSIDIITTGNGRLLPTSVDLAGYRIVQEALTNVVRHANAHHVKVTVDYQPAAVGITVTDDGTAGKSPILDGHGLIGMRERVALHGGRFAAHRCANGGFQVQAVLPIAASQEPG